MKKSFVAFNICIPLADKYTHSTTVYRYIMPIFDLYTFKYFLKTWLFAYHCTAASFDVQKNYIVQNDTKSHCFNQCVVL